jgi:hypothetical protein
MKAIRINEETGRIERTEEGAEFVPGETSIGALLEMTVKMDVVKEWGMDGEVAGQGNGIARLQFVWV